MENTLSIIKPEAVTRGLCGKIIAQIEESGLKIIAQKMLQMTKDPDENKQITSENDNDLKDKR